MRKASSTLRPGPLRTACGSTATCSSCSARAARNSRGEELALALAEAPGFPAHEIESLTGQVDAFLDDLWMSWADWHAEPNPVHREMLAGFLS